MTFKQTRALTSLAWLKTYACQEGAWAELSHIQGVSWEAVQLSCPWALTLAISMWAMYLLCSCRVPSHPLCIQEKMSKISATVNCMHSPSKCREIKQAISTLYFVERKREVSNPVDQFWLLFPPPTHPVLGMDTGHVWRSTDGGSAYGSCQRELPGGVKREDVLPLTPQQELPFGAPSLSPLIDWQQCTIQRLSLIPLAWR